MIAFSPSHLPFPLPEKHRFPTQKYSLLRGKLVDAGWEVFAAQSATWSQIQLAHDLRYVEKLRLGNLDKQQVRALGFPWSPELIRRSLASVGGTLQATAQALQTGFAANLAGGTHHAFFDRGEGFCVFNDVIIAALHFQNQGAFHRAAVVDLDVHQGNGTAALARDYRWLNTISVHGAKNYPFKKEESDLDVALEDGIGGVEYLRQLQDLVLPMLDQVKAEVVFLNAGADVLEGDRFGRLQLTIQDIAARDQLIAQYCKTNRIPLVWMMGGGYHPILTQTVDAHFASLQAIAELYDAS